MAVESPFASWDAKKASDKLGERTIPAEYGRYYDGDHWQDSDGWAGPVPDGQGEEAAFALSEIERQFVSRNVIKEVVERGASGVTARGVAWTLVPRRAMAEGDETTPQEEDLILEAKTLLAEWARERNAENVVREAAQTMLWSGFGPVRVFVPAGELEDGSVPRGDMEESLRRIYLHEDLDPVQSGVLRDGMTQKEAAIHTYTDDEDREIIELAYVEDELTILRVMSENEGVSVGGEWELPLGGRLPVFEMKRKPLISDQVVSQQKMLNLALTMMQRNVVQAGFLERIFLNAQLPGTFTTDADGTRKFEPDPFFVGAGTINTLTGILYTDKEGNERITDPSVVYKDPVPVQTFRETREEAYLGILAEAHQIHYAIAGDATPSGESRKTAMADYIVDLLKTKAQVERAWSWLLETALTMAAVFAGQPDRYAELRVASQAQLDAGPISSDMMRTVAELVREDVELISRETARSWVGVDDPMAEEARIRAERMVRQEEMLEEGIEEGISQNGRTTERTEPERTAERQ